MVDWLMTPIDISREHSIGVMISWHARLMILAWGVIVPTGVFITRYLKILPGQNWPLELDNQLWWRCHWMSQSFAIILSVLGIGLIIGSAGDGPAFFLHVVPGYCVLALGVFQITLGIIRGSKGGPTDPAPDGSLRGDHYDMTRRRLVFEALHRVFGYLALAIAMATILTGMWIVNAPVWMWFAIVAYWVTLICAALYLQHEGRAFDTYQAIWGADPELPGNRLPRQGWWTTRPAETLNFNYEKEKE